MNRYKKSKEGKGRRIDVIKSVNYGEQCVSPPVWEVIDRQQGVLGCWCVEWGEEEDEEIEDEKPATNCVWYILKVRRKKIAAASCKKIGWSDLRGVCCKLGIAYKSDCCWFFQQKTFAAFLWGRADKGPQTLVDWTLHIEGDQMFGFILPLLTVWDLLTNSSVGQKSHHESEKQCLATEEMSDLFE